MRILAIDPGPVESAWVLYENGKPVEFDKQPNRDVLDVCSFYADARLAVEMIASYGMAVGAEVFETCVWIGRFIERWGPTSTFPEEIVYRREVKSHLCHSARAKDKNIRQALIDRYGGKEKAIGRKATPGPLYGISGDVWAALGVAITADERNHEEKP